MSRRRPIDDGDALLRAAFAELQRHEEAEVPALGDVLARTHSGAPASERGVRGALLSLRTARHLGAAALAVFVAAGLGVWWRGTGDRDRSRVVPALAAWIAPTDFLLDTPASELLRSTPTIREALPATFNLSKGDPR